MNRRTFINVWIRTGIIGAFALMTGIFATRGRITGSSECTTGFQCKSCRNLNDCRLPESEKERKNGRR